MIPGSETITLAIVFCLVCNCFSSLNYNGWFFSFFQKVLFSHPDSYSVKKSDIQKAPTLSTGAHSSNNTIKYLKTLLGTFTPFFGVMCVMCRLLPVPCKVSCVICHLSLTIMTTSTKLPLLTFPLSTISWSTEKKEKIV